MTQIRPVTLEDAEPLVELLCANREFLAPWEPIRDPGFHTLAGQRLEIERLLGGRGRGVTVAHVVLDEDRIIELGLHRIEAGTLPRNVASQRVLERNGFERFGLARRYLQIAGRWRDHVLFQKIAPGG